MAYLALRFDVDARRTPTRWADALLDAGALSVDVTDPHAGTADEAPLYGEPGEPAAGLWPVNRLTALFAARMPTPRARSPRPAARCGATPPPHESARVADQDWVRATQAQFAPIRITRAAVGRAVVVRAARSRRDQPDARSRARVRHRLASDDAAVPALARARRCRAASACSTTAAARASWRSPRRSWAPATSVGVDVDPQAIAASRANAQRNGVAATFVAAGRAAAARPRAFDVVVANILANPLVLLAPALAARVRRGGRIVLSGMLDGAGRRGRRGLRAMV